MLLFLGVFDITPQMTPEAVITDAGLKEMVPNLDRLVTPSEDFLDSLGDV